MKTKFKFIFVALVLAVYSLMYVATTPPPGPPMCDPFCEQLHRVESHLFATGYVLNAAQTNQNHFSIMVKDTIGPNWNSLADTTCVLMKQENISRPFEIFVIQFRAGASGLDTLARKNCP